jgi:predicted ATPase
VLTSVHIQSPLTVLVGPNGSGKSAILDALADGWTTGADAYRHDRQLPVRREVIRDGEPWRSSVTPGTGIALPWSARRLRLDPSAARRENNVAEGRVLRETGENLVNVFATLTRAKQGAVVSALCERVPLFSDVNATPSSGGNHRLLFTDRWSPSIRYEPSEVSDGTVLLVAS